MNYKDLSKEQLEYINNITISDIEKYQELIKDEKKNNVELVKLLSCIDISNMGIKEIAKLNLFDYIDKFNLLFNLKFTDKIEKFTIKGKEYSLFHNLTDMKYSTYTYIVSCLGDNDIKNMKMILSVMINYSPTATEDDVKNMLKIIDDVPAYIFYYYSSFFLQNLESYKAHLLTCSQNQAMQNLIKTTEYIPTTLKDIQVSGNWLNKMLLNSIKYLTCLFIKWRIALTYFQIRIKQNI